MRNRHSLKASTAVTGAGLRPSGAESRASRGGNPVRRLPRLHGLLPGPVGTPPIARDVLAVHWEARRDLQREAVPTRVGERAGEIRRDILSLGENCPWALRHLKENLRDINGQRLFPDRYAHTVKFRLNKEEFDLYKAALPISTSFCRRPADARSRVWRWPAPFSSDALPA